jgi:D-serine dehydratase
VTAPLLHASTHKGYPAWAPALPAAAVGQQGWHLLQPDWPLPCAVLRHSAVQHNLGWMQKLVAQAGVDLAPHGKTTCSPELFRAQLDAGAWGITVATVGQLALAAHAGATRAVIANQVVLAHDLLWLGQLQAQHPGLQAPFLIDSLQQLQAIEGFAAQHPNPGFDVLLELGLEGGRTGCRHADEALALARAVKASPAVRLVGLECYEGLWAKGDTHTDSALVAQLMQRVHALARQCDTESLFQGPEVLLTAGGSAVFDLVATALCATEGQPLTLSRPVRGLLRSGCYVTHDHGFYKRLGALAEQRLAQHGLSGQPWGCGNGLQAALEVWAVVQSCPEPGLAILNAGKRDLSFDMGLPTPVAWCAASATDAAQVQPTPGHWAVTGLNDQHAYLTLGPSGTAPEAPTLQVGDRVALGISHPCTTFDKWRWMPLVNDQLGVAGAITTCF